MAEALYCPELHTPGAWKTQLDMLVSEHPDAIVVGSVGRAAIVGVELPLRKPDNLVRDIDLTATTGCGVRLAEVEVEPFPVDNALQGVIRLDSTSDAATVTLMGVKPAVTVDLPPEVFEPYPAKINGVRIRTFHPDTMRHIHNMTKRARPKDIRNITAYEDALVSVDYTPLPGDYFAPLVELREHIARTRPHDLDWAVEQMQLWYFDKVPFRVRRHMTPVLQQLKRRLITSDVQVSPDSE